MIIPTPAEPSATPTASPVMSRKAFCQHIRWCFTLDKADSKDHGRREEETGDKHGQPQPGQVGDQQQRQSGQQCGGGGKDELFCVAERQPDSTEDKPAIQEPAAYTDRT